MHRADAPPAVDAVASGATAMGAAVTGVAPAVTDCFSSVRILMVNPVPALEGAGTLSKGHARVRRARKEQ